VDDGSVGTPGGSADAYDAELADLLADVSRTLATEAEPDRALALVLDRIVPAVADWGTVRLREPDGRIRRVAAAHRDPSCADLIDELWKVHPFSTPDGAEVTELFSGGGAQIYEGLGDELIDLVVEADDEARDVWKRLGLQSLAVVPLLAGGKPLGSIMLVIADDRLFDREGLRTVEGLALQCALLVENTRLVRDKELAAQERTEVSEVLDTVIAHSPAATAVLDGDLRILNANAAFAELGSAEEGTPLAEALSDLAPRVVPIAQTVLDEGRAVDRAMVRSSTGPDGRRYWQVTAFPVDHTRGRLGVGLVLTEVTEERRSARRLTDSLARLDLSLAAGGLGSWDWDFLRNQVVWSGTLADVLGVDPNAFTSDPLAFTEIIHPDDRQNHRDLITAAAQAGEDFHNEVRVVRLDGEERWLEVRGRTVVDAQDRPVKMIGIAADVTERRLVEDVRGRLLEREHQWRIEAEAARERLAVLSEASPILIATLDPLTVLMRVPSLVVPRLGDWCVVDMLDDDGELTEVTIVHRDPERIPDVRATRLRRRDAGGDGLWSVRRAVRTGQGELVVDIGDEDLVAAAADEDHLALLRSLQPRSAIAVPLVARGRVFGGLTVVASGERVLEPEDLTLLSTLAGRIGLAFDNARLFELQGDVARALQATLLPPALPSIDHLELAARYRVAEGGMDIGGDFYDVFQVEDGSWMVVVGDVCGKGPAAAAVTGLFRNTLRAVAAREQGPAVILGQTSDTILGQIDDSQFCTAALLQVQASAGRATCQLACGGHPRPIVVRADGRVERVDVGGTLLGVLPEPALPEVTINLRAGDSVVLYTDGITEARGPGGELFGEARLLDSLRDQAGSSAADLADRIRAVVDSFQAGPPSDDRAIVVARVLEE
jgi:PAS domain S-box-containing protein